MKKEFHSEELDVRDWSEIRVRSRRNDLTMSNRVTGKRPPGGFMGMLMGDIPPSVDTEGDGGGREKAKGWKVGGPSCDSRHFMRQLNETTTPGIHREETCACEETVSHLTKKMST
uniref:Uncharacterized protein n=1 Tax=Vespula pensylvanica TaxID=30213 RepID=A0A834UHJ1_VESPE|nr:hypothetical protein H0235_001640 [Vespula pensylvanica]